MLSGKEFQEIVRLERKLERGETLDAEEHKFAAQYKVKGPKLCGHKGCTNKLGPRVDGEHHKIDNKPVCEDCYFDAFGKALENFPIGAGIRRPRGCYFDDIEQL